MSFLPTQDRTYLQERGIAFEEVIDGKNKGIILPQFDLPTSKYDAQQADLLIFLPSGYPDVSPDMFYLDPWVKLSSGHHYPNRADQAQVFRGRSWQRWSRHNREWRPGIDGIWTMLKRVENALEVAA